ncbi:MAG TPA: hypothetical protein VN706_01625 [Gemmatimonadaceae bacterium]|nr:hypothetical protein [Gemmatimonadaceae bacterium]
MASSPRVRGMPLIGVVLVVTSACGQLAAQEPAPRSRVTLDAGLLAGGLSYARVTSPDKLVGVGLGLGYEFNFRLVHSEPWGTKSAEIAHIDAFERLEPPGRWQYDVGVRAAFDFHAAQVASEAEPGGFAGGYIAPMWGGSHFRIGPRVQAGAYWSSPHPAFGISVTPLTARFVFKF